MNVITLINRRDRPGFLSTKNGGKYTIYPSFNEYGGVYVAEVGEVHRPILHSFQTHRERL